MEQRVYSVSDLAVKLAQDPELVTRIQANPVAAIAGMAAPLQYDVWIYRTVVGALGLTVVMGVVGAIILAVASRPIPEILVALGSAAVGALAGLLAPSPASKS